MLARWSLLPLAVAGMLLAHEAAYRLVASGHDHGAGHAHGVGDADLSGHEALLASTGHVWHGFSGSALTFLAVLSVAAGWFTATRRAAVPSLWKLVAIQSGLFCTVEVLERVLAGHDPIPQASILVVGMLAQFPVAMLVWLLFARVVVPAFTALERLRPFVGVSAPGMVVLDVPSSLHARLCGRVSLARAPPVSSSCCAN